MKIAIVLTMLASLAMSHPVGQPHGPMTGHAHLSHPGSTYHHPQHQYQGNGQAQLSGGSTDTDHHEQKHPEPSHKPSGGCAYGDEMLQVGHEITLLCENGGEHDTYKAVCTSTGRWNVMTEMCNQVAKPLPMPKPHTPKHYGHPHPPPSTHHTVPGHGQVGNHYGQQHGGPYNHQKPKLGIYQILLLKKLMSKKNGEGMDFGDLFKYAHLFGQGGMGGLGDMFSGMPSMGNGGMGSMISMMTNPMFSSMFGDDNPLEDMFGGDNSLGDLLMYSGMPGMPDMTGLMGGNPMAALMGGNPMAALMGVNPMAALMGENPMAALYSGLLGSE